MHSLWTGRLEYGAEGIPAGPPTLAPAFFQCVRAFIATAKSSRTTCLAGLGLAPRRLDRLQMWRALAPRAHVWIRVQARRFSRKRSRCCRPRTRRWIVAEASCRATRSWGSHCSMVAIILLCRLLHTS